MSVVQRNTFLCIPNTHFIRIAVYDHFKLTTQIYHSVQKANLGGDLR